MWCLIVEVLMFIAGLWLLITGRFPESVVRILSGSGQSELSSRKARLIGLLIASPAILGLTIGYILGILDEPITIGCRLFSILWVIAVVLASVSIVRKAGKGRNS